MHFDLRGVNRRWNWPGLLCTYVELHAQGFAAQIAGLRPWLFQQDSSCAAGSGVHNVVLLLVLYVQKALLLGACYAVLAG